MKRNHMAPMIWELDAQLDSFDLTHKRNKVTVSTWAITPRNGKMHNLLAERRMHHSLKLTIPKKTRFWGSIFKIIKKVSIIGQILKKFKKLNRMLYKWLSAKFERWIGGIYNWRKEKWTWGISGEKIKYKNFEKTNYPEALSCTVLDPEQWYKWSARSCIEKRYFLCETSVTQSKIKSKMSISSCVTQKKIVSWPT